MPSYGKGSVKPQEPNVVTIFLAILIFALLTGSLLWANIQVWGDIF